MLDIIKNEIKGRYKFLAGAFTVIILVNLYSLYLGLWGSKSMAPGGVLLSSLLIMPAVIIAVVFAIQVFWRDINTDTAYLMFTVPRSSESIVGGKLLYSVVEYIILFGSSVGFLILNIIVFVRNSAITEIQLNNFKVGSGALIYTILAIIFAFVWLMVLIYFSIVLTKTILNTQRFKLPITFVVFLLINYLTSVIVDICEKIIPYSIKMKPIMVFNSHLSNFGIDINSGFNINDTFMSINISGSIIRVLLLAGLFYLTTYLIDKKLDV